MDYHTRTQQSVLRLQTDSIYLHIRVVLSHTRQIELCDSPFAHFYVVTRGGLLI